MISVTDLNRERLPMWVVYARPRDYPDGYVARLWYSLPKPEATSTVIKSSVLEEVTEAIKKITPGCAFLARRDDDEPQILGTWVI